MAAATETTGERVVANDGDYYYHDASHFSEFQPSQIGIIEARAGDVLARTKARSAFGESAQNNIIFTKQGASPFVRKTMSTLGGDNFLNKWNAPLIPCAKLVTDLIPSRRLMN